VKPFIDIASWEDYVRGGLSSSGRILLSALLQSRMNAWQPLDDPEFCG